MSTDYVYIGCFIRPEDLTHAAGLTGTRRLAQVKEHPHVTFAYRPAEVDEALFGTPVTVTVTGYGNDGTNEGVRVTLCAENAALRRMIEAIRRPHITLSTAEGGRSVDTGRLAFAPIDPFTVTGLFGGYSEQDGVIL